MPVRRAAHAGSWYNDAGKSRSYVVFDLLIDLNDISCS